MRMCAKVISYHTQTIVSRIWSQNIHDRTSSNSSTTMCNININEMQIEIKRNTS